MAQKLDPNPGDADAGYDFLGFGDLEPNGVSDHVASYPGAFAERGVGRAGPLPDGSIPTLTSISDLGGRHFVPSQNIEGDLVRLRAEMPFLPITAWPKNIRSVFLANANVAQNIDIPSDAVLGRFTGSTDYYANFEGAAVVPDAAMIGQDQNVSLYKPEWGWIYLAGLKQVSVVSPNANAIVQLAMLSYRGWSGGR